MARQWAVVVRPDGDHTVRALGPISTEERADRIVERIVGWEDGDGGQDIFGLSLLPQAVPLESVSDFLREIGEKR